jgi:Zn-dependent M28 family amino/carboxypeptidase
LKTLTLPLLAAMALLAVAACEPPAAVAEDDYEAPDLEAALAVIDSTTIREHIVTLSADYMEGRGTGTRGEERAVTYIREQMEAIGLEPGAPGGGYFQEVPLRGGTPTDVADLTLRADDGTAASFSFFDEFITSTDLDADSASINGRLVFVGYGITNSGYDWDDFGDVDVSGKIVVSLVNDPPATAEEPNLFQGDTLTYNGRWTYKYEEARRRGAQGALLIHTDELAGYPFQVLQASARGEQIMLASAMDNPLALKGWITRPVAERLAEMSGSSLDEWIEMAASRDFEAFELPVEAGLSATFETRYFSGTNVIGRITGSQRPDEAVLYTAHHDHLGIDEDLIAAGQDGIYSGATDNASGVAMLLNIAQAFLALEQAPQRSVYFVTVTAEESGLLGSQYYAENPSVPMARTIANVNVDSGNLFGRTEDIVGIGAERSELMNYLREAAAAEDMRVTPDPQPGQGLYFRSDQLSFARAGVPGIFVNTGRSFIGQPEGYADRVFAQYRQRDYHQPSDMLRDDHRFGGIVQQARVAFRLGHRLADSTIRPAWNPSEAFAETRAASEREAGIR